MANIYEGAKRFFRARWKVLLTVVVLFALGMGMIALEKYFHPPEFLAKVLEHLSVGFMSVAILGVIIELKHMHEYFQNLIEKTIIKKEFIKDLNEPAQEEMQKQSLEAFFDIDELGKEGDFYNFYKKKIRSHIGEPYRKDTNFTIMVEPGPDDSTYKVNETISYSCMKRRDRIQDDVHWTTKADEIEDLLKFEITATKPDNTSICYPFDKASGERHESLVPNNIGHGYTLLLNSKDYKAYDGLMIKMEVTYLVSRERPFSWTMPYLSQGFSGKIHFPADLDIFVDRFGMEESAGKDTTKASDVIVGTVYEITHDDWLLPEDGFSFYFRKKRTPPAAATAETVNEVARRGSDPAS